MIVHNRYERISSNIIEQVLIDTVDGTEYRVRLQLAGHPVPPPVPTPSNINDPSGAPPGSKGPAPTEDYYRRGVDSGDGNRT